MAETDLDVLIGRLAVHYKVLSQEQVKAALLAWQEAGRASDFGSFLAADGMISAEVLQKLLKAREHYLQRTAGGQGAAAEAAPASGSLDDTRPTAEARPTGSGEGESPALEASLEASEPPDLQLAEPPDLELDGDEAAAAPADAVPAATAPTPPEPKEPEPLLRLDDDTDLEDLLRQTLELGASDLHLHSGAPLKLRLHGRLVDAAENIEQGRAEKMIHGVLDEEQLARLEAESQADFAYAIPEVGRFRANVFRQQRGLDAVFRAIPPIAPTLEELGLPASFERFASFHQGIVLFTGPAGCGKSSTMAALVRLISENRSDHIITIEDPIEFVHPSHRSIVNQRQVGPNTASFGRALRAALREDPDVIVIGELRDLETVSLALSAAETGHLVFGTLHTSSAIRTVNRVLGVFPSDEQGQIRMMFSESLRVVISQRLIARADGGGRVAATEVLLGTRAVGNLIREQKTFQLASVMQTGTSQGMCLLDVSLQDLVKRRVITAEAARMHAEKPAAIK